MTQAGQTKAPPIADLVATAKRLRAVRRACRQFLALWTLEQHGREPQKRTTPEQQRKLADPMNHDWSLLYLGSVLDD
jgi:hypothetical protein